jgi:hypothetical protein
MVATRFRDKILRGVIAISSSRNPVAKAGFLPLESTAV